MKPIIEIENLSYSYERTPVLDQINLTVREGAFIGLVGPNGSGKTTLLKCILGLLKPQSGSIKLFGKEAAKFKNRHEIGFVSQKANSFNTGFPASVFEVVASGLTSKLGLFKRMNGEDRLKVEKAIEAVGLSDLSGRNIGGLSGGQQQRTFIARALVSDPKLLILDEPTVGVDSASVESFYRMLKDLNTRLGITLILVTHDIGTVSDTVTEVACLNKTLHFHGSPAAFDELDNLSEFYGHPVHVLTHDHHGEAHHHD
ncbi:ATP-binding cassette domain-containing protein [Bacillus mangrovi]|uniref:ATP-binding cassette domain-containing protein n=1 Tax=Metabacillus mangrovi TaxID=1491830 RepID=A0A7X2S2D6_9BACI|nr:metal ABC transporter ATP-binding protein [Metabacillus mangrovi]MTH52443.1 ATP-binding cassette domain-containing protein [Metabacillus mangrovi]